MSMTSDDLEQSDPKGLREHAQRQQERAAEAERKLADLERREAFRDAGLDPSNKLHSALIRGYDGDLDGVKGYVDELELSTNSTSPRLPEVDAMEQQAMARQSGLASGDGGGLPGTPDASGDDRLREIAQRARHEGWTNTQFDDAFVAEMSRQGRPVGHLDIQVTH